MQKFFFHQMDIRRRNKRTITDLKVLTQLQIEIEKFHQIAKLPVLDSTEENSYKKQAFIALKGKYSFNLLSKRI